MKTQTFSADVTRTKVFKVERSSRVDFDIWGTFNSGTVTLTCERDGIAAHDVSPAPDSTAALTGADFAVTAALTTSLYLGEGQYGVTISGSTSPTIYFHVDGRYVSPDENAVL